MKLYILIILTFLTSCATRKMCDRKFPAGVNTTVNTVTVIRDTTIYIEIPGDTVFQSVPVVEGEVSKLNTPLALSYAWVVGGKLNHRLVQKDTVVPSTVKGALKTSIKEAQVQEVKTRIEFRLTSWQQVQVYLGRVFIGLVVVMIAWRMARGAGRLA